MNKILNNPLITQNYTKIEAMYYEHNSYNTFSVKNVNTDEVLQTVRFQSGPVKEVGINGIANEDAIAMVIERLTNFQDTEFRCEENEEAIKHLEFALISLRKRTNRRTINGILGTSKPDK